jgi:hypothetical protein
MNDTDNDDYVDEDNDDNNDEEVNDKGHVEGDVKRQSFFMRPPGKRIKEELKKNVNVMVYGTEDLKAFKTVSYRAI